MATTWNPADKSVNVVLTNGNLTATGITTGGNASLVRGTTSQTTGKFYFEVTAISRDINGSFLIGLANATQSLSAGINTTVNAVGCQMTPGNTGATLRNNVNLGNDGVSSTDTQIGIAIDLGALKIWSQRVPGVANWNSQGIGSANPATGTGGYSLAGFTGPFFICFQTGGAAPVDSATLNAGGSAFTGAVPSGFTAWDATGGISSSNFFFAA